MSARSLRSLSVFLVCLATPLPAHDLYRSESKLVIQGRVVKDTLTFNLLDFAGVDQNGDKSISTMEFAESFDRVYAQILAHYALTSGGPPVRMVRESYQLYDDHVLLLHLEYTFPQQVLAVELASNLSDILGRGHVHLVSVVLNGRLQEQILDGSNRKAFFTQTSGRWWQTMGSFVWLGIQHIATGYDHIAA